MRKLVKFSSLPHTRKPPLCSTFFLPSPFDFFFTFPPYLDGKKIDTGLCTTLGKTDLRDRYRFCRKNMMASIVCRDREFGLWSRSSQNWFFITVFSDIFLFSLRYSSLFNILLNFISFVPTTQILLLKFIFFHFSDFSLIEHRRA